MPDHDPVPRDENIDARFEAIVEQLRLVSGPRDEESKDPDRPTAPTADTDPGSQARPAVNPPPVIRARPVPPPPPPPALEVPVWRGATSESSFDELLEKGEDEHYVPPPPRPLPPQEDLHFWGIIIGLVGGTILLLWLVLVRPDVANWWTWLAVAMIVGGFVLLVLRGGGDDDQGDGAVV